MWQKTRHEPSLIADFLVSNSPSTASRRSPSRCGSVTRGSDSPPGCHSLPLARLRLRLAYPLHGAGKHVRNLLLALSTWFLANQKYNWALVCLIFVRACHQRALLIRITYKHFIRGSEIWPFPLKTTFFCKPPARVSAVRTKAPQCTKKLFQRSFTKNLTAPRSPIIYYYNIIIYKYRIFSWNERICVL